MTTKKKRQKFAFSDETMKKLEWLVQEHKTRRVLLQSFK